MFQLTLSSKLTDSLAKASNYIALKSMLQDTDVDVVALLNDTVGTLMACAFKDNTCQIGVILGTGTNACYMEKLSNCPKLKKFNFDSDSFPKEVSVRLLIRSSVASVLLIYFAKTCSKITACSLWITDPTDGRQFPACLPHLSYN